MYVQSQNLLLGGQETESLELLRDMIDIGWLDQGLLAHDPRWAELRQIPEFIEILQAVTDSTSTLRKELIATGAVSEFEQALRGPVTMLY